MSTFEGLETGIPELEPRDYLFSLKLDFDVDSQLIAIGGLLHRHRKADEAQEKEIEAIEEHTRHLKGLSADLAVDSWVDEIDRSAYQSAAHSMSAAGLLAPLTETIFCQCFRGGNGVLPRDQPSPTECPLEWSPRRSMGLPLRHNEQRP